MSRAESSQENAERGGYTVAVVLAILLIVGLLLLPFAPLLLALLETVTLGTQRVEEFCRTVGIHDELSALYQSLFSWFK